MADIVIQGRTTGVFLREEYWQDEEKRKRRIK
jgi:hypothetical protein